MKSMNRRTFLRRSLQLGTGVIGVSVLGMPFAPATRVSAASVPPALVDAEGRSDTAIQLLWTAVPNATAYTVYRNNVALLSQPGTLYSDTGLSASTRYSYAVTATIAGTESTPSAAISTATQAPLDAQPPTQPGAITVSNITSSSAKLSWTKSTDNVGIAGYRMLRGAGGAPLANLIQIGTCDSTVTSYTATNLRAHTAYQFAVIALDAAGNLSAPRTATFTTSASSDTTVPAAPANSSVVATPFSSSRIDVVWGTSSASDIAGYQVYRDGALVAEVYLPMRRYFSDSGLAPSSSHSYQVRAIDSAGNTSSLTTAKNATTLATGTVKIVRGPYLQCTTASSAWVVWWTNLPSTSQVNYGIGSLTDQVSDPVPAVQHIMLIGGLTGATTYSYQVVSGSTSSATLTFRTAAAPGATFTFAAIGDFGGGSANETGNANHIAAAGTEFVQTLGDNVYPDCQDPNFATTYFDMDARLYKPFAAVMSQQTMWFANGNKEYYGDGAMWRNAMTPNNKRWYSYDWGDVHMLVLDGELPYAPGTPQYGFAQADLIASQSRPWRLVAIQNPPYSSSTNNSSSKPVQQYLVPLFEQQRVHLVMSGNSHNYERSHPLIGGVPASGGVTYIVSGGGGNGLNSFTIAQPAWSAFRQATYEYLRVTVSTTALRVDAILQSTGAVLDTVSIAR